MTKKLNSQKIYLIRHASPDWKRTDIPYTIPPGPPLTLKGENEAKTLGVFIKNEGVTRLYYSPLERSSHTARIAAEIARISAVERLELAEWREEETETDIQTRFWPLIEASLKESAQTGPVGLVTHGGPITYLLKQFGVDPVRLANYSKMFDTTNPLPPAGVWVVHRNSDLESWTLNLVFNPSEAN